MKKEVANSRAKKYSVNALAKVLKNQWRITLSLAKLSALAFAYSAANTGSVRNVAEYLKGRLFGSACACVYGIGEYANKIFNKSVLEAFNITALCDSEKDKQGGSFMARPVISPEALRNESFDYIFISAPKYVNEIYANLTEKHHILPEKILFFDTVERLSLLRRILGVE